ncbi:MAG: 23S rRNA (adenine(2503)-C(2))-methyltransferase RlmN [Bacteroidota bacterium]|jgi:23S rRNA (adenine2503-C2)-methyltransferase
MKEFIKNYSLFEIENLMFSEGQPKYRAKQIYRQIYENRKSDFKSMSDIPADLKTLLEDKFEFDSLKIAQKSESNDKTVKFLMELSDGKSVETVLIPGKGKRYEKTYTLCVSSQVGCSFNCPFCATGKLKYERNLTPAEIIDQYFLAQNTTSSLITNIVFMGMGEPLANFDNVLKSIRNLTELKGKVISPAKITVSTIGIVPKIYQLADEKTGVKLAISLHATTDTHRSQIVPASAKWNLSMLTEACEYFYKASKLPITFEYIMFEGINDTLEDCKRLAKIARKVESKVNLIPFNDISFVKPKLFAAALKPASTEKYKIFKALLEELNIPAFIRSSSGADIAAACGQLAYFNKLSD